MRYVKQILRKTVILPVIIAVMTVSPHAEALADSDISAKSAVLIDMQTGRMIFGKDENRRMPMASTTKIMTTLLTLESGDLDTEFMVDSEAIKTEGSSMGLIEGDIVTKRALCIGMLLPSGNDAANAAAVRVGGSMTAFADMMNRRAEELGLAATHFVTPSGLHDDSHYSSAWDMARLASAALDNPDFAEICRCSSMKLRFGNPPYDRWLANSNKLLKKYDGCIGVKTGFTDEAGRCLVSAVTRDDITLICVTLNAPDDWNDHIKLYDYGFGRVKKVDVDPFVSVSVSVAGGTEPTVSLTPAEIPKITCITGQQPDISWKCICPQRVYAPISKGTELGRMDIYDDGRLVASIPLTAASDICQSSEKPKNDPLRELFASITDKLKTLFS